MNVHKEKVRHEDLLFRSTHCLKIPPQFYQIQSTQCSGPHCQQLSPIPTYILTWWGPTWWVVEDLTLPTRGIIIFLFYSLDSSPLCFFLPFFLLFFLMGLQVTCLILCTCNSVLCRSEHGNSHHCHTYMVEFSNL